MPDRPHALGGRSRPVARQPRSTSLAGATDGSVLILGALVAPVLMLCIGFVIDYSSAQRQRSLMQAATDAAALAGAKELSLADAKRENMQSVVDAVVQKYVEGKKSVLSLNPSVVTEIIDQPLQVKVEVTAPSRSFFGALYGMQSTALTTAAVASVAGQPNICVLALDTWEPGAVSLEGRSRMIGNNCAVFSNSKSSAGLTVRDTATLQASTICSSGGAIGQDNVSPSPFLDCPQFEDPLQSRPEPPVGKCDHIAKIIAIGHVTLEPGVYCLGLTISGVANVTFKPGIYIIKDGPLTATAASKLSGTGVGFFLTGASFFTFDPLTTIDLSAPTEGPLAGLLFFGSRQQLPLLQNVILSSNAQNLTGTIYLPKTSLIIDDLAQVGGASKYTAIVARRVQLLLGPNVVLNTDYDQTDVPVPDGIKNVGQPIRLVR